MKLSVHCARESETEDGDAVVLAMGRPQRVLSSPYQGPERTMGAAELPQDTAMLPMSPRANGALGHRAEMFPASGFAWSAPPSRTVTAPNRKHATTTIREGCKILYV